MVKPENPTGIFVAWRKGTIKIMTIDNPSGNDKATISLRYDDRDSMCYMYFYSYVANFVEPPTNTWRPRTVPAEAISDDPPATNEDMEVETESRERDSPETRTVVLGPESNRPRNDHLVQASEFAEEIFMQMHRRRCAYDTSIEACHREDDHQEENADYYTHGEENFHLFYMSTPGWFAGLGQGSIFKVRMPTPT